MATITTPGPYFRLDGPLPQPRPYSLLSVAQYFELAEGERWGNGVWVQAYPSDPVHTNDPCSTGSDKTKVVGGAISQPFFGAFTAYLTETCLSAVVGPDPAGWFTERAAAAFKARERTAAERVLVNGDALPSWVTGTEVPHLTDANLDQLAAGAAQNFVEGLALLENAIGGSGSLGVIHATPAIATLWESRQMIRDDGRSVMRTIIGTPVAVGAGYIGAYPDGGAPPASGSEWAFATGQLKYLTDPGILLAPRLLPDNYQEALNRHTNLVEYRAERDYVIVYDSDTNAEANYEPLQVGVLINRASATP